jgi:sigma54-dependent transcription regulator
MNILFYIGISLIILASLYSMYVCYKWDRWRRRLDPQVENLLEAEKQWLKDNNNESKMWETNYNNLSAEFEEVSAIAQKQEVKITNRENVLSYVKTVLVDARNYVADRALSIEDDIDEAISTIEELLGGS